MRPIPDDAADLSGNGLVCIRETRHSARMGKIEPDRGPDRRTERTRAALMSAFVQLVLTVGYDALTVEDVATRANVGRSTFYMHHKNKEAILRESLTRPSSSLAIIVGHDVSADVLVPALAHFHEQRAINRVFFTDPIRGVWIKCLAAMIEPRLTRVARQAHAAPALPLAFIAHQIAEAQIALVTSWLAGRAPIKPPAIAEALIATTRALMVSFLGVRTDAPLFIPGETLRTVWPATAG
jgi:AcrR family transcriptional regulator